MAQDLEQLPVNQNNLLSLFKEHNLKFKDLLPKQQIFIIIISMMAISILSWIIMAPVQKNIFGNINSIYLLQNILSGDININNPSVQIILKNLFVNLFVIFLISTIDMIINIVVLIASTKNKNYPPGRNKTNWLIGLWSAFLFITAPTGIPSAIIYWYYIVRPNKKLIKENIHG